MSVFCDAFHFDAPNNSVVSKVRFWYPDILTLSNNDNEGYEASDRKKQPSRRINQLAAYRTGVDAQARLAGDTQYEEPVA